MFTLYQVQISACPIYDELILNIKDQQMLKTCPEISHTIH